MASYRIYKIPLDATFTRLEIQPAGQFVPNVGVISLPASAAGVVELHIGSNGDGIPLFLMGQAFPITPAENDGIYLTNPTAQAGQVLVLLIGFAVDVVTQRQ